MVLDHGGRATGQDTGSGGEFAFQRLPAAAEADQLAAEQPQRQPHLDTQPAQAAAAGAATLQGQIARLPAAQKPHPAADKWWSAMHANFTATVEVHGAVTSDVGTCQTAAM